jgi:hypothetical protein
MSCAEPTNDNKTQDDLDLVVLKKTILELNLWQWFIRTEPPQGLGYTWWDHDNINKIVNQCHDTLNHHSGGSFGLLLRKLKTTN